MPRRPASYLPFAVLRVAGATFLITALSFALALFFGIVGVLLVDMFRGGSVNLAYSYRHIAFPIALGVLWVAFVLSLMAEIRNYRQRTRTENKRPLRRAA